MRGASALESLLEKQTDSHLRVFVVWEPVLATDLTAPSTITLRRIHDPRVKQYWDSNRLLSHAMGEHDRPSVSTRKTLGEADCGAAVQCGSGAESARNPASLVSHKVK